MFYYLLFTVYFLAFCWLLTKIRFVKNAGLNNKLVVALFACKVAAGIVIGWVSLHLYGPGNDYWDVNREGAIEYQLLFHHPRQYFSNLFSSDYPGGFSGVFDSFHSFWNDLRNNVVIKLVSVFNLFSRGHYYINSLFFNFLVFFGHVALYRLFIKIFTEKRYLLIACCFLLPSMLYFTSGIHKDGLVFLTISLISYGVFTGVSKKRFSPKAIIAILLCLAMLFILRNFVLIALAPALVAWLVATRSQRPVWQWYTFVYILSGIILFTIHSVIPSVDPMDIIVQRQADFATLPHSATEIPVTPLQPGFYSFVTHIPEAFDHSLLRPYLWDRPTRSLWPFAIELFIYLALLVAFIFSKKEQIADRNSRAFLYFSLFFSLTALLFIGLIVPNIGSLVRYRSIYLPFLITPILCSIRWKRFYFN